MEELFMKDDIWQPGLKSPQIKAFWWLQYLFDLIKCSNKNKINFIGFDIIEINLIQKCVKKSHPN